LWSGGIVDRRAGFNVGVDSTAGADLAGMKVRRLLEPDHHLTIRLPPLLIDIVSQVPSETARHEIGISAHILKIVPTEGNDVLVRGQKAISPKRLDAVARFPA